MARDGDDAVTCCAALPSSARRASSRRAIASQLRAVVLNSSHSAPSCRRRRRLHAASRAHRLSRRRRAARASTIAAKTSCALLDSWLRNLLLSVSIIVDVVGTRTKPRGRCSVSARVLLATAVGASHGTMLACGDGCANDARIDGPRRERRQPSIRGISPHAKPKCHTAP